MDGWKGNNEYKRYVMTEQKYLIDAYVKSVIHKHPSMKAICVYGDAGNGKTHLIQQIAKKHDIELIEVEASEINLSRTMTTLKTPKLTRKNKFTGLHIALTEKPPKTLYGLIKQASGHAIFIEAYAPIKIPRTKIENIHIPRPSDGDICLIVDEDYTEPLIKFIVSQSKSLRSALYNLQRFKQHKAGVKCIGDIELVEDIDILDRLGLACVNNYKPDLVSRLDVLRFQSMEVAGLGAIVKLGVRSLNPVVRRSWYNPFWLHNNAYNKRHGIVTKKKVIDEFKVRHVKKIKEIKEIPVKRQRLRL